MNPNAYPELLAAVGARDIPYVLLRDHPETPGMRDLDLLIDRARVGDFLACSRALHFQVLKSGRLNPGKMVLLRWQESGVQIIDLHERLIFRGHEYLDAGRVLARRRRMGNYYHLSPEDELLTLFLHNVLGKGEIQSKHRERLETLLAEPLDEAYLRDHLRRYGLQDLFQDARRQFAQLTGDPRLVAQFRRRVLHQLHRRPAGNIWRQVQLAWRRLLDGWVGPRRGALIAFVGPDGCGKSSLTSALREEFRRATLAADILYLGPWGQHRLPLHDLLRRFNVKPQNAENKAAAWQTGIAGHQPIPPLRFKDAAKSVIFYLALAVELWFRYLVLVLPRLRRGRVVLADRFIYDILVGYKNRPVRHFGRLRAWLCRHYPRPDLTILLDAKPEVIHARKPQFEVAQLATVRSKYHALQSEFELHPLDTSVSLEVTLANFRQVFLPRVLQALQP